MLIEVINLKDIHATQCRGLSYVMWSLLLGDTVEDCSGDLDIL